MSTEPNGFETPKTNWQAADVPTPTDFNRIEGNSQAIEEGSRTVDQTQSPSGLTGSLRQFLDWIPNRIKAITGKTNWYDAPSKTLEDLNSHMNNTNNPHSVTKTQIGLSSVLNYGIATQAEAEAGTSDSKYMTPLKTKNAIDVLTPILLTSANIGNVQVISTYGGSSPVTILNLSRSGVFLGGTLTSTEAPQITFVVDGTTLSFTASGSYTFSKSTFLPPIKFKNSFTLTYSDGGNSVYTIYYI